MSAPISGTPRPRSARSRNRAEAEEKTVAAREHLAFLKGNGFGDAVLARVAQLPPQTLANLTSEKTTVCAPHVASAILSLTPSLVFASCSDLSRVPSYGVRRRFEALACRGWTSRALSEVAESQGIPLGDRTIESAVGSATVTAATHRHFDALYRMLFASTGPSSRTRAHAAAHDWTHPAGWIDIDDPSERPALPDWTAA